MNTLRIILAQLNFLVGDIQGNCDKMLAAVHTAKDELHADAILFPELATTGYPADDLLLRDDFIKSSDFAIQRFLEIPGIMMIVGHPVKIAQGLVNRASVIYNGQIIESYDKQCLPNYGVFDEKRYFQSGHEIKIIQLKTIKLALTICEDLWEGSPIEKIKYSDCDAIISLNASPFDVNKATIREQLLKKRALYSKKSILYVNHIGGQDELVFSGDSQAIDASGKVAQKAPLFEECLLPVDFDAANKSIMPATILPHLASDVRKLYGALVLGVGDYVRKNKFPGVIIGLSGGIDSAVTLAIAVAALGAEKVKAILMPSRFTSQMSIDDAIEQARNFKVEHSIIPIEQPFTTFLSLLKEEFKDRPWDTTEENIQARCRGMILMAISNKTGRMVLTTGNKSEMSVGYATLYGDMAGGFGALVDVTKTRVCQLAEYINRNEELIPRRIITRPPSAELAANQLDQDSLPPYEVLDPILEMYIEQDKSIDEIESAGFERKTVTRIIKMINRNEYKRYQAPPGIRVSTRALGHERRYPITSGFHSEID